MAGTRGRKPLYKNEAERQEARKKVKEKFKNVSLDADLVDILNSVADKLENEFGFRPTLSQAVRYLIKKESSEH